MTRKRLAPGEARKVLCIAGNDEYLITQKADGYFGLYKLTKDGYEGCSPSQKVTDPAQFDSVIWPDIFDERNQKRTKRGK